MASDGRQQPQRPRAIRVPLLALAAALLTIAALAAPAGAEVVYDNPPVAAAPTLDFEATGTAELGTLVRLAGAARLDPTVRLGVVNSGPAAAVPITLSLYAVGANREPGPLLVRETRSFELAATPAVQPVEFALAGARLPEEAIVSVGFDAEALGVALAGPAGAGSTPREAEGVYRAATPAEAGATPVFAFEPAPLTWEGRQPAFTVEAAAPPAPVVEPPAPPVAAAPAAAASTAAAPSSAPASPLAAPRRARREYRIPASKRMSLRFPRRTARLAGPGALVRVRCTGASAARCIGTLSLSAAGAVHKAPYSIGKGRRQYVVVPLGQDLELLGALAAARVTVTASTVQIGGAAVKTKRALKLK